MAGLEIWIDVMGFCLKLSIVHFCRFRDKATYNSVADILNNMRLTAFAFVMSLALHPNINVYHLRVDTFGITTWMSDLAGVFAL